MYGRTLSPHSTAFLASSPAPNITDGLLVLVQLVIAAMTTEPVRKKNENHAMSEVVQGTCSKKSQIIKITTNVSIFLSVPS